MAGGDGSQALVASVAMAADVALVCIPAGTRNHFALDLGLDRDDVVGALDAYADAVERRIDLATVGDRVFVNNVSLGVYAKVVQSEEYRDAKRQTTAKLLPELLGPDADPFDLRHAAPTAPSSPGAQIIMVSNNPYRLTGSRGRRAAGPASTPATLGRGHRRGPRGQGDEPSSWPRRPLVGSSASGATTEWATPTFTVRSDSPVEAGRRRRGPPAGSPPRVPLPPGRAADPACPPRRGAAHRRRMKDHSLGWTVRALVGLAAGRGLPEETPRS